LRKSIVPDESIEHILVVPTSVFRTLGYFQGFCGDVDRYLDGLFQREHISYRPRPEMEKDPSYKQLIPYVIFRHRDGHGRETVLQYTRGKGQGEGRLHHKRSVGIGGHISSVDASESGGNPYEEGMRRELAEEVIIQTPYSARCVGLINDDQTEVGQVHLGVVHIFDVERPEVYPREAEIIECGFRPVEEILADMTGFETWSEICMKALFAGENRAEAG
jgi:predicted NUDIX family phosphoesterase